MYFTSPKEGWAIGSDDENLRGVMLHYRNGSWTISNPPNVSPNWELKGVNFVSPYEGWGVGYDWENKRGVLLKYLPDTIILLTPNGGEIIPSGSTYRIEWRAPSQAVEFKLSYSMDNGTTWKPMAQGFVPGRTYNWPVPVNSNM